MQEFELEMSKYAMEVLTKSNNMDKVMDFVELSVRDLGNPHISKQLTLVGEELAYNIFSYAYDDSPGAFVLKINLSPENNKVTMEFRDEGKPFNPLDSGVPDLSVPIAERKIGGLGIALSKKLTDKQIYKYENGHNILVIEKNIEPSTNAG